MEDIVPGLLKKIQEDFQSGFDKSELISDLYAKVRDGTATYKEANDFAIEVGEILSRAYKRNLSSGALPDGRMYYNIANRIITPTITNNYDIITEAVGQVQKSLNESTGIGMQAITPEINQDRIEGIIDKVSEAAHFDEIAWILGEPVVNFSQSIVDDFIRANAEFQAKAGLKPVITRRVSGNCCKWCRAIAGIYNYPDVPKDVYRRHQRCRCTVTYYSQKKRQDVWSKAEWTVDDEELERRKNLGTHLTKLSASEAAAREKAIAKLQEEKKKEAIRKTAERLNRSEWIDKFVKERGMTRKQTSIYYNMNKTWLGS